MSSTDYPFNPPPATVETPAPPSPGDVDPRDQEIAQLRQVIAELEAQRVEPELPTSSGETPATSTSADNEQLRAGTVVGHAFAHPTDGDITRYGIVVKVHDPSTVLGADGNETEAVLADVVWFGADGLTTVPLDELDPID